VPLQVLQAVLVEVICLQTLVRRSVERERCRRRFLVCPGVIPIVIEPASGLHRCACLWCDRIVHFSLFGTCCSNLYFKLTWRLSR